VQDLKTGKKESGCFFTLILKETLLAKLIYAKSLVFGETGAS
jgi:hypothetical protein